MWKRYRPNFVPQSQNEIKSLKRAFVVGEKPLNGFQNRGRFPLVKQESKHRIKVRQKKIKADEEASSSY